MGVLPPNPARAPGPCSVAGTPECSTGSPTRSLDAYPLTGRRRRATGIFGHNFRVYPSDCRASPYGSVLAVDGAYVGCVSGDWRIRIRVPVQCHRELYRDISDGWRGYGPWRGRVPDPGPVIAIEWRDDSRAAGLRRASDQNQEVRLLGICTLSRNVRFQFDCS